VTDERDFQLPSTLHRIARCRYGLMLAPAADTVIGKALALYGEFAESENRVMSAFLGAGEVAVDVGANIGTVTLALARTVGPAGRVVSLEPQRLVFQCLSANLALNGVTCVIALPFAVGRTGGKIAVPALDLATEANFGGTRLGQGQETALMIALDSLTLKRCSLIKLDVEGMEFEVLEGAAETIRRTQPVIYFEAKTGPGTERCIAWLLERGYRLWWHFAAFFEPDNYRGNASNVFGGLGDINALAVPSTREMPESLRLPAISGPTADWRSVYQAWLKQSG
jgi:FkbM family methyltransferase